MATTNTFNPFLINCASLQELLNKASQQKNAALWLSNNNARTPLFMLEALTRLHNNAFDEKLFSKWHKRFKTLEDTFGEIDYYNWLLKEFSTNKKISPIILNSYKLKADKIVKKLNKRLIEKHWLNGKLNTFANAISEFTIEYNKEYITELKIALDEEIASIITFLDKIDFNFTMLEEHVHELRRKLRWLSIYAQALNGLIQVKASVKHPTGLKKYFTKNVINSPFNKLPKKPVKVAFVEYDSNSFFALSWIINELGVLKDDGLKFKALSTSIYKTEDVTEHWANQQAAKLLGFNSSIEIDILKQTSEIVKTFIIDDAILKTLLVK